LDKLSSPCRLSFYLLGDTVYFNRNQEGIGHSELWQKIVKLLFFKVNSVDYKRLLLAWYGINRGRVTKLDKPNAWAIYATPECRFHEDQLIDFFHLQETDLTKDFETDLHYKMEDADIEHVHFFAKWINLPIDNSQIINHFVELI
jgi:hypothetical protein